MKKINLIFINCLIVVVTLFKCTYADNVKELFHHPHDPYAGNPKGDITIVEFFDYQCSHCIDMDPILTNIIKNNPNVRVVFKEFPIRGPISNYASVVALAANLQKKYLSLHHQLLTASETLSEKNILSIAKNVGLDVSKLKNDMKSSYVENQLEANNDLARHLKLTGTPAYFIGKTNANSLEEINFILGEMSQTELQNIITQIKQST